MAIFPGSAIQTSGYNIENSLRFNSGDSTYLSWTPSTAGNRTKWTFSLWIKRSKLGDSGGFLSANVGNEFINFPSEDGLSVYINGGVANVGTNITAPTIVFRDPSAWYHLIVVWDTANQITTERLKLYVNGAQIRSEELVNTFYPNQYAVSGINDTIEHSIGRRNNPAGLYFDGYMAEVNFIDGQALDPADFGEVDPVYGNWVPKEYAGTYGTNGFYLPFKPTGQASGFNTVLYRAATTDGTYDIKGFGFNPDLLWIKNRDNVESHYLFDTVRGVAINKGLLTNSTAAEGVHVTSGTTISMIDGGFRIVESSINSGEVYFNNRTYVAWAWDAGSGSAVSNTDGDINSTVKANDATGFSIVSYTGNGTSNSEQTIGHGLSTAPKVVIVKNRTSASTRWQFYSTDLSSDATYAVKNLLLNSTAAESAYSSQIRGIQGSNTFSVRDVDANGNAMVNKSGDNYIAYCFHSVAGYSDFGTYTGTGVSGLSVTTGFRPAFVMIKKTSNATNSNWNVTDATRSPSDTVNSTALRANTTDTENTVGTAYVKFTNTGFEITGTSTETNESSSTYIYMAFADTRDYQWNHDASGNLNNWIPNNINSNSPSETNYALMNDVPTLTDEDAANFCTLNPLRQVGGATITNGNLTLSGNDDYTFGTIALPSSGKFYYEMTCGTVGNTVAVGVADSDSVITGGDLSADLRVYASNGNKYTTTGGSSYGATYTTGDVIGVACDMTNNTILFYKNNVSQGNAFTDLADTTRWIPYLGSFNVTGGGSINFGQRPFKYTPPTGFKKLNTYNLPDPAVKPKENFNVVTYSGSSSSRNITGIGFQPDLVWAKDRTNVVNHTWTDSVRGAPLDLFSSSQSLESNDTNGLTSFNSDGFSLGTSTNHNVSGHTYVAWNWKANEGTTAANEDGSISSTVSVNADAGFSIVGFTSPSSGSFTMGHGLGASPDLIIMKRRASTANWGIFHSAVCTSEDNYFIFNTNALLSYADYWGTALPTSTVFGANVGASAIANEAMIAYCFRSVEGYSSFGKYTGNGSTDGTFVYTGFRPAWVMTKRTDSTSHWMMYDTSRNTFNQVDDNLYANLANAENNDPGLDILSNGFKLKAAGGQVNVSSGTYIYMAFAENPFKYANARGTSFDKYSDPTQAALTIPQSARFDASSTAYLSRTPASAGNQKTWTWSGWVKRSNIADNGVVFAARTGAGASYFNIVFNPAGDLRIASNLETAYPLYKTNALFRDPSAWYHIVVALDMTQATSTNRLKVYINGVLQTTASYNVPAQNTNLNVNSTATHLMGQQASGQYLDGYMAEVNFIDGQALGPESFGYQDTTTKQWLPRTYDDFGPETNYGSNGFRLDFQSGALGNDVSGNNHDWTLNNMSTTTDVVLDSPSDNYAVLNPLNDPRTYVTYSNANLKAINTSAALHSPFIGTIGMFTNSGKYYWEVIGTGDANTRTAMGIGTAASMSTTTVWGFVAEQVCLFIGGAASIYFSDEGTTNIWSDSWSTGDVLMNAYDANTGKYWVGKNGNWYDSSGGITGNPATGANPTATVDNTKTWFAGGTVFNQGANSYLNYNFGQESFSHTAPTGFYKLSTTNLPDSTIKDGSDHFEAITRNGFGSSGGTVATNFQADLIWEKPRNAAYSHYIIDNVRGIANGTAPFLSTNGTSAEQNANWYLPPTSSTIGFNSSDWSTSVTIVDWIWKANGSGVSNTDGSITSTVSANPTAGFSIVSYTGNGTSAGARTVGHGLNTTPSMVIVKSRAATRGWETWFNGFSSSEYVFLNTTAAKTSFSNNWGSTPTSTVFGVNNSNNSNNANEAYIAYVFAEVPGYSAFGSYTGNGSTDGPFVYTGFRPAWVMIKRTDSATGGNWQIQDTARTPFNWTCNALFADSAAAENTSELPSTYGRDYLSNGFKIRSSHTSHNINGATYIYIAFAENPFKNSNAR